jgi:hypothetical protein
MKKWLEKAVRAGQIKNSEDWERIELSFFSWNLLIFLLVLPFLVIFAVCMSLNYLFGFYGFEKWRRSRTREESRPHKLSKRIGVAIACIGSIVTTPLLMLISDCCLLMIWASGYEVISRCYLTPLTPRSCGFWPVDYLVKCVVYINLYVDWLERQIVLYEHFNEISEVGLIKIK